jgi:hypothetical protein
MIALLPCGLFASRWGNRIFVRGSVLCEHSNFVTVQCVKWHSGCVVAFPFREGVWHFNFVGVIINTSTHQHLNTLTCRVQYCGWVSNTLNIVLKREELKLKNAHKINSSHFNQTRRFFWFYHVLGAKTKDVRAEIVSKIDHALVVILFRCVANILQIPPLWKDKRTFLFQRATSCCSKFWLKKHWKTIPLTGYESTSTTHQHNQHNINVHTNSSTHRCQVWTCPITNLEEISHNCLDNRERVRSPTTPPTVDC